MLALAIASGLAAGACGSDPASSTTAGTPSTTSSLTSTAATTGADTTGSVGTTTGAGPTTSVSGTDGTTTDGTSASVTTATATQGAGGTGSSTTGTDTTGTTTAGEAPAMLSQTGLYTERAADGTLVLAEGVREFEPKYWLWSDGSDKKRYVYLPPDTQIDTSDPDHWVLPVGTKLWKSFISGDQLVETRLIERTGEGEHDFRYATYFWMAADATDATLMKYNNERLNAAGTTHDIPSGPMCERCHNGLQERALGFSALQLNHDLGGLNLATLLEEGLLTDPISLEIRIPGDDPVVQDALGYLHANCGNCHNDSPGLPDESVPPPQLLLRVLVDDLAVEDTDAYQTAVNQPTTASDELGYPWRIYGGDETQSALYFRMTRRMIEDQMPPIGTEVTHDEGLAAIQAWIQSLPPPP